MEAFAFPHAVVTLKLVFRPLVIDQLNMRMGRMAHSPKTPESTEPPDTTSPTMEGETVAPTVTGATQAPSPAEAGTTAPTQVVEGRNGFVGKDDGFDDDGPTFSPTDFF